MPYRSSRQCAALDVYMTHFFISSLCWWKKFRKSQPDTSAATRLFSQFVSYLFNIQFGTIPITRIIQIPICICGSGTGGPFYKIQVAPGEVNLFLRVRDTAGNM